MSFFKKIWRPLFAILFLFILIKKGPFKIEQLQFALSQPRILILGIGLSFLQFILLAYRWKIFVDFISGITVIAAFRLTLIGQYFSFFIPGGVGADVIKAFELSKDHKTSKSAALSTVIADRFLGLFSMILLSSIFLTVEYFVNETAQISRFLAISWILFLAMIIGFLFTPSILVKLNGYFSKSNSRILDKINKFINSFGLTFSYFKQPKLLIKNILLCFVIQLVVIYFMYAVIQSLQVQPPPFFVFFALCCFGFIASAIPLTPAGIGVGQAAFYFLFSSYGSKTGEAAVTAVSVFQLFQLFYALFGGIFFSIKTQSKKVR